MRGIEDWVEYGEPTVDLLVPADGDDEKIARPSGGNVGDPDRLVLLPLLLFGGGLEKLDRCRTAERLKPNSADGVDVPVRVVALRITGGIRQDEDRKLESLRLMQGHQPHALGSFLDDRRFIRLAVFAIQIQFVDETRKDDALRSNWRAMSMSLGVFAGGRRPFVTDRRQPSRRFNEQCD